MSEIKNPHDRVFKRCMADPRVARDFLQQHLPERILKIIDLDMVEYCSESLIDESLKLSVADLVYRVNFGGREGFILTLIEHQSKVDPLMPFRILEYVVKLMARHLAASNKKELPIVYTMVLYQGQKRYDGPIDIFDMFGEHRELARECLFKPFQLIDLSQIPDEVLFGSVFAGGMEFIMKHARTMDFMILLKYLVDSLLLIRDPGAHDLRKILLKYILEVNQIADKATIELATKTIAEPLREEIMSAAEQLREEGRKKGIQQGVQQGIQQGRQEGEAFVLKEMLTDKFGLLSTRDVERIQKANSETLLLWVKRVLRAQTLNDVFNVN